MGIFDRLFGNNNKKEPDPIVHFGRYSDAYKSPKQLEERVQSFKAFDEKRYRDSFIHFFNYLADEQEQNVSYQESTDQLSFELIQGSKKITGTADDKDFRVEAKIVHCSSLNVGFMRRLMEKNYTLHFGRFALDDENNICLRFDSYSSDSSPYKLYSALKEVAINADKQDDLLLDEFDMLQPISNDHIVELSDAEKEAKVQQIRIWIQEAFALVDTLKMPEMAGGISYILLSVTYKIDYLLAPEGFTMEACERIHRIYFTSDNKSPQQKGLLLKNELQKILDRTDEELKSELYHVVATFGITADVQHDRIVSLIDAELPGTQWYMDNNHPKMVQAICTYIAGFSFFNHALPLPIHLLFHFYLEMAESSFFKKLNFDIQYFEEDGSLNKSVIKSEIQEILSENRKEYPKLNANLNMLDFSSFPAFSRNFMLMVRELDLSKK